LLPPLREVGLPLLVIRAARRVDEAFDRRQPAELQAVVAYCVPAGAW
jgi:hypothetical protein